MKVRISFTVDIDPGAWAEEYGTDRSDLRADVLRHVEGSVMAHLDSLGVLA